MTHSETHGISVALAYLWTGIGLIAVMAGVFAISTIATYVLLCAYSTSGLQRVARQIPPTTSPRTSI